MLWAIVQYRKPLSSMSMEDCEQYRQFLADPSPRDVWCSTHNVEKWSPLWRPFRGPLSRSAQTQALTILRSLYTFLVAQGYLTGNPWKRVSSPKHSRIAVFQGRSLFKQLKAFFRHCANELTSTDPRGAERIAQGSTHWLQHTHGTHAAAAGMPLDVVQSNKGHASLDTTTGYITSAAQRKLKASRKVFG